MILTHKTVPNCFISRFKNHSNKIDLKKGLLQYSSSSLKNRSAIIAGWEDEGGY